MPGPLLSEVHYNRPLASYLLNYATEQKYVSDLVAPTVPSQFKSDKFYVFRKEYWLRAGATVRAPGAPSAGGSLHLTAKDFNTQVYAFHYDLADQIRANTDSVLQADQGAGRFVISNLMNSSELSFASTALQLGVWTGLGTTGDFDVTANGGGAWNTDSSNPVRCIRSLATKMQSLTTRRPNTLVLTQDVADALMDNKYLIDLIRFGNGDGGFITAQTLQRAFDVERVIIMQTVLDTSQTGLAPNTGFLASNKFLLCYTTPTASMVEPTAIVKFLWTGYLNGAGVNGLVMKQFRMESLASDRFEGEMAFQHQIVAPDLGILGTNILAA